MSEDVKKMRQNAGRTEEVVSTVSGSVKYLLLRMEGDTDLKRLGGNLINSVRGWCTQMGGRMCC
jgi:hypothetical protein